ncbi:MAG: nucleotide exchange factor GrpE [Candidatus Aminicenantes bacterium]|nr:nucleotide exchange factor GrpE [Candidatus Aminicenantes bacterium]
MPPSQDERDKTGSPESVGREGSAGPGARPGAEEDGAARGRGRHGTRKEPALPSPASGGEEGEEFDRLLQEREEYKDKYLRTLAEAENQRKRAEREKSEYLQFALADSIKDFLEVVDSLERALSVANGAENAGFREGVSRIHKQFLDVLAKKGVAPIPEAAGGPFDPNIHQALTTEQSEAVEEPVVAEELQRGYRIHERLLRPSLVRVLVPKKDERA